MASASRWVENVTAFLLYDFDRWWNDIYSLRTLLLFAQKSESALGVPEKQAPTISAIYITWCTHQQPTSPFFIAAKNRFPTSPFHALCILPFQFLLRIKRLSNQRPGDTMLVWIGSSWERNCSDKGSPVFGCAASPRDTKQHSHRSTTFNFTKHRTPNDRCWLRNNFTEN